MTKKPAQDCDLIALCTFLGKKWTIPILHILGEKPICYNELSRLTKSIISPTILSHRLRHMIKFKLIKKNSVKNKHCYCITEQGRAMKKILHDTKKLLIKSNLKFPKECESPGFCSCQYIFHDPITPDSQKVQMHKY